jgi:hypothetical protein
MVANKKSVTRFLNVDLDVRAQCRLDDLLLALEPSVFILHQSAHEASLELLGDPASLEEAATKFVEIVLSLPSPARSIWDRCDFRRFVVGIQAGPKPHAENFTLSSKAVALLASIHVDIVFTVYAPPLGR